MYVSDDRAASAKSLDQSPARQRRARPPLRVRVARCVAELLPAAADILPLLGDEDRFSAFAARRVIEQLPVESWNAGRDEARRSRKPFCVSAPRRW